jgi:LPLT family lysophospholipid transporter-like MFS transporter
VGLGAAAYSPAKYGILTELLPPSQLVKANGWIEGLTIASIILGVLLGGQLVGPRWSPHAAALDFPLLDPASTPRPRRRSRCSSSSTCWRRCSTCYIPRTEAPLQPAARQPGRAGARLLALQRPPVARQARPDLAGHDDAVLGRGRQPALHRAGLGRRALGYGTTQATQLVGVVAIGTAVGAVVASMRCGWTAPPR